MNGMHWRCTMDRKYLIIPAALLAASVLFAGRALVGSLELGPESRAASTTELATTATTTGTTNDDAVAERTETLDALEQRLDTLDAQRAATVRTETTPAATVVATTPAAAQHGGGGRDHAEDDGTVEHPNGDDR